MDTQPQPAAPEQPAQNGWTPTGSTVVGLLIGEPLAQIIVTSWNSFLPAHAMDTATAGAVHALCIGLINYFHKDGGRK